MRCVKSPICTSGDPVSVSCVLNRSISSFLLSVVKTTFFKPPRHELFIVKDIISNEIVTTFLFPVENTTILIGVLIQIEFNHSQKRAVRVDNFNTFAAIVGLRPDEIFICKRYAVGNFLL